MTYLGFPPLAEFGEIRYEPGAPPLGRRRRRRLRERWLGGPVAGAMEDGPDGSS